MYFVVLFLFLSEIEKLDDYRAEYDVHYDLKNEVCHCKSNEQSHACVGASCCSGDFRIMRKEENQTSEQEHTCVYYRANK